MDREGEDASVDKRDAVLKDEPEELPIRAYRLVGDHQNADRLSSRGRSTTSSNRLTMLLRSSLRLSAPRKKSSISSARSLTAPCSPNLAGIPRPFIVKEVSSIVSASSLGYPFCRICHDTSADETLGRLISPCLCDGSLKYVHEKCIQRWVDISNSKRCELCHFEYEINSYTKPLNEWRCCPFTIGDLRKMFCFTLIYLMIQASVGWALYALITNISSPGVSTPRHAWQFWLKQWRRINRVCQIQEPSGERIAKLRLELRSSSPYGQDDIFTSLP
nr:E3 ubiquitin protein ligase MARCH8 [Hymenolepis microstoma]